MRTAVIVTLALLTVSGCDSTAPIPVEMTGVWETTYGGPSPFAGAKVIKFTFQEADVTLAGYRTASQVTFFGSWTATGDTGVVVPAMTVTGDVDGTHVGFMMQYQVLTADCFNHPSACPVQFYEFVGAMNTANSMAGTLYVYSPPQYPGGPTRSASGWAWNLSRQ